MNCVGLVCICFFHSRVLWKTSSMNPETNYIRLRGLPFAAKEQDVRDFLQGFAVLFFFGNMFCVVVRPEAVPVVLDGIFQFILSFGLPVLCIFP